MKKVFIILTVFFLVTSTKAQTISIDDIKHIAGSWSGTLSYLDYSSNKEVTIQSALIVKINNDKEYALNISFPKEPGYGGEDIYSVKEKGTMINDMKIIERMNQPDGTLKVVMESKGTDGNENKMATFHHIMLIGKKSFNIIKMVKFDGEEKFIQRNQFAFNR